MTHSGRRYSKVSERVQVNPFETESEFHKVGFTSGKLMSRRVYSRSVNVSPLYFKPGCSGGHWIQVETVRPETITGLEWLSDFAMRLSFASETVSVMDDSIVTVSVLPKSVFVSR